MQNQVRPFAPGLGASATLNATAASSSVTLDGAGVAATSLRIANAGPSVAMVRLSNGAGAAAVATDMAILSGATHVFAKGVQDTVSAICPGTGTATLYITPGYGN